MRPAIEDWVGAGMVVAALVEAGAAPLSAEALAAKALYDGIIDVPGLVFECASGRQLADMGFGNDVAVATEMDTTTTVLVLTNGMFVDGAASPRFVPRAEQRQT